MKKIILAVLICLNLSAKGQSGAPSQTQTIVNGDVEIVQVEAKFAGNLSIDSKKKRWLSVPGDEKLKFAVVSAGYRQKGEIKLINGLKSGDETIIFKIVEGEYKKEKITVEGSKVTPPKEEKKAEPVVKTEPAKKTEPVPQPQSPSQPQPQQQTAKPASPQTASTGERRYGIQCGAFNNKAQADALQVKLNALGLNARVNESADWNRVVVGPAGDRNAAVKMQEKAQSVISCVVIGM